MTLYLIAYLLFGVLCVFVFPKPIENKLWPVKFISSIDGAPRWRYLEFAICLYLIAILIWPFYIAVAYGESKGSQPM
jgi:hypothetical protein